jgi:hypothetical protein
MPVLRRLWEGSMMESLGLAEMGVGVGVAGAAALLLMPGVRKQLGDWGSKLARGAQDIWNEARESPGLMIGATAVAAGGAALAAAPTGGASAGAAAAAAAPTAATTIPLVLEGIERGVEAKKLVEDLMGEHDKRRSTEE